MPTTPTYGFPYPALSDAPDGPSQIEALAEALETKIAAMDAILNAQITNRFMGSSAPGTDQVVGTTETILDEKVTFNAVAGHRYLVEHTVDYAWTGPGPTASTWNFRYAAGASLTTSGTLIQPFLGPPPTGAHMTYTKHTVFTAPSTGQFTVGLGAFTNGGSSMRLYANSKRLTVTNIT